MAEPAANITETRRAQAFPILEPGQIERLSRFGQARRHEAGQVLVRHGETGHGLTLVLSGEVEIRRPGEGGALIVTHGPGSFMGELANLSGQPSLVDATAKTAVEAVEIAPDSLRAVLVREAELGEQVMRALILRRVGLIEAGAGGPIIVGPQDNPDVRRLSGFLNRSGHPLQVLDPAADKEARCLIERFHVAPESLPIVLCPNGELLRNPTESQLARCLGLVGPINADRLYDVAVIGAGPAGLATAVYAGSEGLSVLCLDCRAFGGQAGASSRIENYLGFPTGISGMALMARAYTQAQKFGVEMAIPDEAALLTPQPGGGFSLGLANGETARARAAVIASGARYRRLDVPGLDEFEAASVHYWASPLEGKLCAGQEVALVGGGNSAGQAVVFLASQVAKVYLMIRGRRLEDSMSRYLVDRIAALPNVELVSGVEVTALEGRSGQLEAIRWRDVETGEESRCPLAHLFLFIGAEPNSDWLAGSGVELDNKGFIRTGAELEPERRALGTSVDGVFAIGDVRCGSVKRVAAAVGEGAQVVAALHGWLAEQA